MKKTVDLCIVGGAGSGLCAAVRARQCGVKSVLVIDKQPKMGGCTRMAQGMFSCDSPVQKRNGDKMLTADECFNFHMAMTNCEPDGKLVRKWLTTTGKVVGWLEDYTGVEFIEAAPWSTGLPSYHMTAKPTGNDIVNHLLDKCRELGVELINGVRARHLTTDEDGNVIGVQAEGPDGEAWDIRATRVILATGSISANKELVARFYAQDGDMSNVRIMANVPHNTGDGLIMAEELGAANTPVGNLYIGPHNHPSNPRTALLLRRPHTIKVNLNGERFVNEDQIITRYWGWTQAVALNRQPKKMCWGIVDSALLRYWLEHKQNYYPLEMIHGTGHTNIKDDYGKDDAKSLDRVSPTKWLDHIMDDIEAEIAAGRIVRCDTMEEVAAAIGCPVETIRTTIEDYNRYCEQGYDEEFLKNKDYLFPLKEFPMYVMVGHQGIDTPIGGLRIDHNQKVIRKDFTPIPNLYACGILTGGWMGRNYGFFGSEMSYVTYSGYAAGENAARDILAGKAQEA